MIDLVGEFRELETFVRKETRLNNVTVITPPAEMAGVSCHIDHGSSEDTLEGNAFRVQDFAVTLTFRANKDNWREVMKYCLICQGELAAQKGAKWLPGAIERVEDTSDYILRLLVSMKLPYA